MSAKRGKKRTREESKDAKVEGESKSKKAKDKDSQALEEKHAVLMKLLECPVCYTTMAPPIQQCKLGHTICSDCCKQVSRCPTCRDPLRHSAGRSLALEQMAAGLDLPCKFQAEGCNEHLPYENLAAHQQGCSFSPVHCLCEGCDWKGHSSKLVAHMVGCGHGTCYDKRKADAEASVELAVAPEHAGKWACVAVRAFDTDFIFWVETVDRGFRAAFAVCGGAADCKKFVSEVTLVAAVSPTQRPKWSFKSAPLPVQALCHPGDPDRPPWREEREMRLSKQVHLFVPVEAALQCSASKTIPTLEIWGRVRRA